MSQNKSIKPPMQTPKGVQSANWAIGYAEKKPLVFDTKNEVAKVRSTQVATARSFKTIMRDEKVFTLEEYGIHARARDFARGVRENAWTLSTTIEEHWKDAQTWFEELNIEPVTPQENEAIQIAFGEALQG